MSSTIKQKSPAPLPDRNDRKGYKFTYFRMEYAETFYAYFIGLSNKRSIKWQLY